MLRSQAYWMKLRGFAEQARRNGNLWAGLTVSLALHFMLFLSSVAPQIRHGEPPSQRVLVTLIPPTPPTASPPPMPRFAPKTRVQQPSRPSPVDPWPPHSKGDGKSEVRDEAEPAPIAPPPSIDLDQARRIARDVAGSLQAKRSDSILQKESSSAELARRLQPDDQSSGQTLSQNQSPEAKLARRLQRAPTGETLTMPDGTVVMRFPGGVCVTIPPPPRSATVGLCIDF